MVVPASAVSAARKVSARACPVPDSSSTSAVRAAPPSLDARLRADWDMCTPELMGWDGGDASALSATATDALGQRSGHDSTEDCTVPMPKALSCPPDQQAGGHRHLLLSRTKSRRAAAAADVGGIGVTLYEVAVGDLPYDCGVTQPPHL